MFIVLSAASLLFVKPRALRFVASVGVILLFVHQSLLMYSGFVIGDVPLGDAPTTGVIPGSVLGIINAVVSALLGASVITVWRLRLAHLDILEVKNTIARSFFLAIPLFLASIRFLQEQGSLLLFILPLVSLLSSFFVSDHPDDLPPVTAQRRMPDLIEYYGVRILNGIIMGFALVLRVPSSWRDAFPGTRTDVLSLVVALISLAVFVLLVLNKGFASRLSRKYFPILPFIGIGLMTLPFIGNGIYTVAQIAIVIALLSWYMFSIMQIPIYKNLLRMRAAFLVFTSESVVFLSWSVGVLVGIFFLGRVEDPSLFVAIHEYLFVGLIYFATLMSAALIIRSNAKSPLVTDVSSVKDNTILVCEVVSRQYGLTTREGEVLQLLAAGYTQPLIETTLRISQSTIKTHISHIYQKTSTRKKQELIALIEHKKTQIEAE
jgi:DNA-binding CsgD family transcriptional regulator